MTVEAGERTLTAEVAATVQSRTVGLMNRPEMAADHGMLFLFASEQQSGFWMKNTLIPLSIAFLRRVAGRSEFEVVAVLEMQPCTADPCTVYRPDAAYDAALEANAGWFDRAGVGVGATLRVRGPLPQPQ